MPGVMEHGWEAEGGRGWMNAASAPPSNPRRRRPSGGLARSVCLSVLTVVAVGCATAVHPELMYFGPWGTPVAVSEQETNVLSAAVAAVAGTKPESLVLARYTGNGAVGCGPSLPVERRDLASLSGHTSVTVDVDDLLARVEGDRPWNRPDAFAHSVPGKAVILELALPRVNDRGATVRYCLWEPPKWDCILRGKCAEMALIRGSAGWVADRHSGETEMVMGPSECP
jgi:hypothetical protein